MKKLLFILLISVSAAPVMAQTYTAKVSKDSVGILTNRIEILKANINLLELKVQEAKEEDDVEKLRLKLLEANGTAKESADKASKNIDNSSSGKTVDLKAMEKLSKKAKSDGQDAQKALDRFNKQITKVEDIRTQIQGEERKLGYKKPNVVYNYK